MRILIIKLLLFINLYAAFELSGSNGFLNGLSGSSIATDQFYSAYLLNPSVSSVVKGAHFGLTYFRPYGFSELHFGRLISSLSGKGLGMGLSFSTFGNSLYHENDFAMNVSKFFSQTRFSIGLNVHWYSISIENYNSINTFGIDIGGQFYISRTIITGFSIHNINQPSINGYSEEIPLVTRWGMAFRATNSVTTYFTIQKDSWYPINLIFGVNFKPDSVLSVQSGFNTYPSMPTLGINLNYKWSEINYTFQYHFDLGITHLWGISFKRYGS